MKITKLCLISTLFVFFSQNLIAANRYWVVGVFSTGNWNSTANWSTTPGGGGGASVPEAGDVAIFDGGTFFNGDGRCNITAPVTVQGITVDGYINQIVQGANTINITGPAFFGSGTFTGGSSNITIGGTYTLTRTGITNTSFVSTSATLEFQGNVDFDDGTFTHNNGRVKFNAAANQTTTGTTPDFYDMEFVGRGFTYALNSTGNFTVANDLFLTGTATNTINTGIFDLAGDLNQNNTAAGGGGTARFNFNGTGAQSVTSTAASGQGRLPYVRIQKASGTLTLNGTISESRDWTYVSGTVAPTTSTVVFGGNSLAVSSTGMSFYNTTVSANTITLSNNITVTNDLTISGTGVLTPGANTINLGGDWTNWGVGGFIQATSTVNMNGGGIQIVTVPGGETYTNLTINKSGGEVQLANIASVTTALTMTQGNINLNSNTFTLGTGAMAGTRGTLNYTTGNIIGTGTMVRWFSNATIPNGSTIGLFPMGTSANARPFYVSAPSVAPSAGGTISVAYVDATTNTSTPTYMDGVATVQVRKDLHWNVSTGGLTMAGTNFNLQIRGTNYGLTGATTDLRLTRANTVVGTAGVNGGTTANPQINRTGLTAANLNTSFYIGSINSTSSPLPVTLISFTANAMNNQVVLKWITAAEINNDYFILQRSKDGSNGWENFAQVKGIGNSNTDQVYAYTDVSPYDGNSYYRFVQVDFDGKKSVSPVRAVSFDITQGISVYPNPASVYINIEFSSAGKYTVSLFNSSSVPAGRTITESGTEIRMDLSGIPSGVYFLRTEHENKIETRKIIVRQ